MVFRDLTRGGAVCSPQYEDEVNCVQVDGNSRYARIKNIDFGLTRVPRVDEDGLYNF